MRTATPRTLIAVAACSALLLTVAGCSDDPEPIPTTSAKPTPSETAPAWQSKYSKEQIADYTEALARFTEYEAKAEPIWADGKATVAAKEFFKEYWVSPNKMIERLETYDQVDVQTSGTPKVYWSKASHIEDVSKDPQQGHGVVLQQCVDFRTMSGTQNGKPTKPAEKYERPVLREVGLLKVGGAKWLITEVKDEEGTPCDPKQSD